MNMYESGILLNITISKFNPIEKKKQAVAEYAANHSVDSAMYNATMRLVPKEFIDPIQRLESEIRSFVDRYTFVWQLRGERFLPVNAVDTVMSGIAKYRQAWAEAVESFCHKYDSILDEAQLRLGKDFNPAKYPSRAEVASRFTLAITFSPVPQADYRCKVAEEWKQELVASTMQVAEERFEAAKRELRERFIEKLRHLANQCADTDKRITSSAVDHVRNLIDDMPQLLIDPNDTELLRVVREAEALLSGVDAEDLRNSEHQRNDVATRAAAIANSLKF